MSLLSVLMKRYFCLLTGFLVAVLLAVPAASLAQGPTPVEPEPVTTGEEEAEEEEAEEEEQEDLARRVDLLAEELERLRSGEGEI